jgi:hypothetical protein
METGWKGSAELYRSGEVASIPYDLADPYERAAWTAMQLNADVLERLAAQEGKHLYAMDRREVESGLCGGDPDRRPRQFERTLVDLLGAVARGGAMDPGDLYFYPLAITRVLFGVPDRSSEPEGRTLIPSWFWDDPVRQEEQVVAAETAPADIAAALAPLGRVTRVAHEVGTGAWVSHSTAAGMLGLSEEAVLGKVAADGLSAVWVAREAYIPARQAEEAG